MDEARWVAHALGLVPLLAVAWYRPAHRKWWWLAAAFGVSFLADTLSLLIPGPRGFGHQVVSQAYPLLQAGLFALVLAPRPVAVALIGGLAMVSAVSLGWRGAAGLDLLLHVAAFGSTAWCAWHYLTPGWLRETMAWGFALLAVAWVGFRLDPSFAAWAAFQAVRVLMAAGFCMAIHEATSAKGEA